MSEPIGSPGDSERVETVLTEDFVLAYPYRRSVGPVLGSFFTALTEGRILGARTARGPVIVPPLEYDPETGEACTELIEVGPSGVVVSWTWQAEPRARHPLSQPFAWALIRLAGADSDLLHAVEVAHVEEMHTGMSVQPSFREDPQGGIHDLRCFVPEGA
jgi:uncharacterized OB-fold protein